jgi:hypothetical protein
VGYQVTLSVLYNTLQLWGLIVLEYSLCIKSNLLLNCDESQRF